ncbi:hypothetical protein P615_18125 [Brevibacillus laterosporus PE36]|nr:hypothetical protein P615_18125 [Brevibacillus laterosporus PE36]
MKKITEIEAIKNLEGNFFKVFKNKAPFSDLKVEGGLTP